SSDLDGGRPTAEGARFLPGPSDAIAPDAPEARRLEALLRHSAPRAPAGALGCSRMFHQTHWVFSRSFLEPFGPRTLRAENLLGVPRIISLRFHGWRTRPETLAGLAGLGDLGPHVYRQPEPQPHGRSRVGQGTKPCRDRRRHAHSGRGPQDYLRWRRAGPQAWRRDAHHPASTPPARRASIPARG